MMKKNWQTVFSNNKKMRILTNRSLSVGRDVTVNTCYNMIKTKDKELGKRNTRGLVI